VRVNGEGARRQGSLLPWLLTSGALLSLVGCFTYDVNLGSVSEPLVATTCGTWDSAGTHETDVYFVGHSSTNPNDTISYFVFDLTPVEGKTLTDATLTIPGTGDWAITVASGSVPDLQFKLGTRPLPPGLTLAQVTEATDAGVYQDVEAEEDLGFGYMTSGATTQAFDAFHYDTARLQGAVNDGGLYPLFAVSRLGLDAATEEYLYGGGVYNQGILFTVTFE